MPLTWDNTEYRLEPYGDGFRFMAQQLRCYDVTLCFLALSDAMIEAVVTYASASTAVIPVTSTSEAITRGDGQDRPLSPTEREILSSALRQQPFTCPHCRGTHPWNTLFCKYGRGFAEIVYPSLQGMTGFVQLSFARDSARFRPLDKDVLRLQDDLVAIRNGRRCTLARFERASLTWQCTTEVLAPYHQLEDGSYAILL